MTSLYAVTDPSTGEVVKEYPTATDADVESAVAAAAEAFRTWSRGSTVAERAALVKRVGALHAERRDDLAAIIQREMGKPLEECLGEVDFCTAIYDFYADNAEELMADEPIELLDGEGSAFVRRSSLGALLGIMPWNFPYCQVARFAGPNLVIEPAQYWSSTDIAPGQEVVFIGVRLDREPVQRLLTEALLTDEEFAAGQNHWLTFTDPLPAWGVTQSHSH